MGLGAIMGQSGHLLPVCKQGDNVIMWHPEVAISMQETVVGREHSQPEDTPSAMMFYRMTISSAACTM